MVYLFFLLLVISNSPHTTVGVITENGDLDPTYNSRTNLKTIARWAEIERVRGEYDWSKLDARLDGYQPHWIQLHSSPQWAVDPICKIPPKEYWGDFHRYVQSLVDRYKPEYIEIWNEPDVLYQYMNPDHARLYGCVGDGELYGEFVEKLYNNVTGTRIIAGAMMNPRDETFVLGMLEEIKDNYDGISFHCYEQFYGKLFDFCIDDYEYVQTLTDKPVYLSETAVYYRSGSVQDYETAQVEYYRRLKYNLPSEWFWYTINPNGWPECKTVSCSTDMVYWIDGEIIYRPIWYIYNQE